MEEALSAVTQVCRNKTCGYIMNAKNLKREHVVVENSKPKTTIVVEQWKCPRCFLTQRKVNEED